MIPPRRARLRIERGARVLCLAVALAACTAPTLDGDADAVDAEGDAGPVITSARVDASGLSVTWTFDREPSVFDLRVRVDGVDEPQVELDGRERAFRSSARRDGRELRVLVQACRRVLLQPSVCTAWSEAPVQRNP